MIVRPTKWTPATLAVTLTLLRRAGLTEMIDSRCRFDKTQRNLTPGEVVLLLIGATVLRNRRIPLYKMEEFYSHIPVSGILGKNVEPGMLNDHALARGLDCLSGIDRRQLAWDVSRRFEVDFGIVSDILHLDQTKVRTFVIAPPEVPEGVPRPEYGLDKEGRTDFRLYTVNSMTDSAGVIRYIDTADGNAADPAMDADAITFVLNNTDPERTVVVMDSKGANSEVVELADEGGLAIVSKVPANFSSRIRDRIGDDIRATGWGPVSDTKRGHRFFDTDVHIDGPSGDDGKRGPGRDMRLVAFRSEKMVSDRRASLLRAGGKAALRVAGRFGKALFDSETSAMMAVGQAQEELLPTGHALKWSLEYIDMPETRARRGRPATGEVRTTVRKWKVVCEPVVDEEWTDVLNERDAYEVLVTNLPRPGDGAAEGGDVRKGASPETVLSLYLGQYRQEHSFRLLKGHVGLCDVYFKTPSREASMVLVLGIAAMVRNVVNHRFKERRGTFTTFEDMVDRWAMARLKVVGGELELDGDADQMYDVMERLDLTEEGILGTLDRRTGD